MSAFPPVRSLQSIPISTDEALQRLQSYLEATKSNPFLLPNATLQVDGPKAQSESTSSLVIHNLKRVEAGLRGEWLAPSLELETDGVGGFRSFPITDNWGAEEDATEEGWQDLDEYQREQSTGAYEVSPTETGTKEQGKEAVPVHAKTLDKEARKREKKKRMKKLKAAKIQAQQGK